MAIIAICFFCFVTIFKDSWKISVYIISKNVRDDNQLRGHHFLISTKTLRFRQANALAYLLQSLIGVLLSLVLESLRLVGLNRIFLRIGISFYYILTAFQFSKDLDCKIFHIFSIFLATDTRQSTCLNRP